MSDVTSQEAFQANTPEGALARLALPVVTAAIFAASTLLFWVQPMFGKMVLPLLGGTPAVWTTALLFFQTALLLGYLYAHALGSRLKLRSQVAIHVAVLALATLALPIVVPEGVMPPAGQMPAYWLIGLFAMTVGIPYTAVAATSPLLQRWFALSGHPAARDPYHLYVASNAGSLLGLLGYPLLIEPLAGVSTQTTLWSSGFLLLIALIALSGIALRTGSGTAVTERAEAPRSTVTAGQRIAWTALAFVPSSLLLGVTSHITTDIAAMPLLWAAPLALYLVTFILAFARSPVISRPILLKAEAFALVMLAAMMWFDGSNLLGLAIHLAAFFIIALSRHSELADTRPSADNLTEFYLWLSFGGALGGVFNAVIAPELFSRILEYPITLVAAGFTRVLLDRTSLLKLTRYDLMLPCAAAVGALVMHLSNIDAADIPTTALVLVLSPLCLLVYHFQDRPARFAFGLAAMFLLLHARQDASTLHEARSFFGAYRIFTTDDGQNLILAHGTTIHGAQGRDPARRHDPLTYYASEGPLGQAIRSMQATHNHLRYGVIGLGVGASACYSRPADSWTLFEIDPLVVELARDHGAFSYVRDCVPNARIVIGDARQSLKREPEKAYDILILDAFSSDSIPTHLMTSEAMKLVRSKLAPEGIVVFNISNRYLRLETTVANAAATAGLSGYVQTFHVNAAQKRDLKTSSQWIVLTADPAATQALAVSGKWQPLRPDPATAVWTDDYSNLLGVIALK